MDNLDRWFRIGEHESHSIPSRFERFSSIPWSTEVGSSLLGFLQKLRRVNPIHGFPLCIMAFDVVLHPDATTGVFSGVVFLGEEGSTSWANRPIRIC